MQPNVGTIDRVIRIVLGVLLIGLGLYNQAWWGAIGVVPIATAILRWCPAYVPVGFSSCAVDKEAK
jgi:predicted transporter